MTNPSPPGPVWNPEKQVYDYPSGQPSAPPPHVGQPYSGQPEPRQKPRKIWPARHPVWTSLGVLAAIGVVAAAVSSGGSPTTPTVAASSSAQPQITASESADGRQETTLPPPNLGITPAPKPKPKPAPAAAPVIPGEGTFLVGDDVKAGRYRSGTPDSGNCYWARLSSTDNMDIIANNNSSGPSIVTIRKTDVAFETSGCNQWTKIG